MGETVDCIVVGSGSAGSAAARACRREGLGVTVIENRPPGGTCAQRGCIPKKVLAAAAAALDETERWGGQGLDIPPVRLNWADLQRFKETFTRSVPERTRRQFREQGIRLVEGTARFTSPDTLRAGGHTFSSDRFVIAVGAEPVPLPVEGVELLATSEDFLALETLPRSLILVGGGFIGFEFAHIAARAGVEVTLLQRNDRALPRFDPDQVESLCTRTRDLGVSIHLGHEVKVVERRPEGGIRVTTASRTGPREFQADLAVHSAGRAPNLKPLCLDAAGVQVEDGKPVLTEYLQSATNPRIYMAGDAAGTDPAVTPAASRQGTLVARNFTGKPPLRWDGTSVPSVVFTTPPLARVGLLETEARKLGMSYTAHHGDTASWFTARHVHETQAAHRILVEDETGRILGAHLLGPEAAEVINLFALAMENGLTSDRLADFFPVFPTASSDVPSMMS